MLLSLTEALHKIMPEDERLEQSFEEVIEPYDYRGFSGFALNSALIDRTLAHERTIFFAFNTDNSKLPVIRPQIAAHA